jgi:Cu/Ag efflux protein CusF
MKSILRVVLPLLAAGGLAATTVAQPLAQERGNILAVDWNAMQVKLRDPQGHEQVWKVSPEATVKFTDKTDQFPNPKVRDLRPPMYVHFTYNNDTKVINRFEVVEVGFDPTKGGAGATATQQLTGVITNLDANIGHIELNAGAGPQTFQVVPKDQLRSFKRGDRVTVTLEKREGQSVVTQVTRR